MSDTTQAGKGKGDEHKGGGAICGGVISKSYLDAQWKEHGDPYGVMMAWVMPDKEFELYREAKEKGDDKTAKKLFDENAWSMI